VVGLGKVMHDIKNYSLSLTTRCEFDKQVSKLLSENPSQPLFANITKKPKRRSLPANSVYYAWIPAISDHTGDSFMSTRNILKVEFGLPIIMADKQIGPRFAAALNRMKFWEMSYRDKIGYVDDNGQYVNGVMELFQITSLMSTKQHNQMREQILHHYVTMGVGIDYEKK
jgi:hypothetical protein